MWLRILSTAVEEIVLAKSLSVRAMYGPPEHTGDQTDSI